MDPVKIKDNQVEIERNLLDGIPNLVKVIENKSLEQLASEGVFVFPELLEDSDDLTKDQVILKGFKDKFSTGNVMGFLGFGNEHLVIESRFSNGQDDYFFHYMLGRVFDIPNLTDLKTGMNREYGFLDYLIFLFPFYLRNALKKGIYKEYVLNKYNDSNVKGVIDVSRHIKQNTPFIGKVAYNLREYAYDNDITQLIRHTIEYIKAKPIGNLIFNRVKDEVQSIVKVTQRYNKLDRSTIINKNLKKTVKHSFYKEYLSLQRLCLMILRHQQIQTSTENNKLYGILFDGSWLWEEYIARLVKDHFYHPMNKSKKHTQYLFAKSAGDIYPDFIGNNKEKRIIADAKYKPSKNINGDDYLQLLAYMYRFESNTGFYFYPQNDESKDISIKELELISGSTFDSIVSRDEPGVKVIKLGFPVPLEYSGSEEIMNKIEEMEGKFIDYLRRLL